MHYTGKSQWCSSRPHHRFKDQGTSCNSVLLYFSLCMVRLSIHLFMLTCRLNLVWHIWTTVLVWRIEESSERYWSMGLKFWTPQNLVMSRHHHGNSMNKKKFNFSSQNSINDHTLMKDLVLYVGNICFIAVFYWYWLLINYIALSITIVCHGTQVYTHQ